MAWALSCSGCAVVARVATAREAIERSAEHRHRAAGAFMVTAQQMSDEDEP